MTSIEDISKQIADLDRSIERTVDQRDAAEECLSQMYYLTTGRSPEWSNMFGHAEALEEVGDAITLLKETVQDLRKQLVKVRALISAWQMEATRHRDGARDAKRWDDGPEYDLHIEAARSFERCVKELSSALTDDQETSSIDVSLHPIASAALSGPTSKNRVCHCPDGTCAHRPDCRTQLPAKGPNDT